METTLHKEKRAYRRISARVPIKFLYDNHSYAGAIENLSENGMFIRTDSRLYYYKSKFTVLIPLAMGVVAVAVKVCRLVQSEGSYDGMGVKLLDLPQQYMDFVENLKNSLNGASNG